MGDHRTAGDTIELTMNAFTLQDPFLFLLNDNAKVLASNDDPPAPRLRITFVAT